MNYFLAKIRLSLFFVLNILIFTSNSNASNVIRLVITNHTNSDETIILFNPLAGNGLTSWDSEKMMNTNPAIPQLFTKEGNTNLVINSMPEIINGMIIPIFLNIGQSGQHQIIPNLSQFDLHTNIILEDKATGIFHDLRKSAYRFHSNTVNEYQRFHLHFNPNFAFRDNYFLLTNNTDAENINNWNKMQDGTGNFPTNFLDSNAVYFIANNKTANINSHWSVKGKLVVDGILNINAGKNLSLEDSLVNNGFVNLKSDFTNGTATLITKHNLSLGTFNVEQAISGTGGPNTPNGRGWYISSPVVGAKSDVFIPQHTNKIWSHSEINQVNNSNGYTLIEDGNTILETAKAYVVRLGSNGIINFSGNIITEEVVLNNLSKTGTTNSKRGFHLLGNPYTAHLNWNLVQTNGIEKTIWFRTANAANHMVFDTYNSFSQIGTSNNQSQAVSEHIPPMQGFWVRVDNNFSFGNISFNNSMLTHQNNNALRNSKNTNKAIRVKLTNNENNSDEAIIVFKSDTEKGINEWDSEKMMNNNENIPEIFTKEENTKLVINCINDEISNFEIPVYIDIKKGGYHKLKLEAENFPAELTIYLHDLKNGFIHKLNESEYLFNSEITQEHKRFIITTKNIDINTQQNDNNGIILYSADKFLNIYSINSGYFEIFDISGKSIIKKQLNAGSNQVQINNKGIYIIKIITENNVYSRKFVH